MEAQFLILCSVISLIFSANAGDFITAESGNRYYLEEKFYNWYRAISVCAQQNMILATPDSESKQAEIFNVTKKAEIKMPYLLLLSQKSMLDWWTSGHEVERLNFVWTTNGNKLSYTNWKADEPTRRGFGSQCITFTSNTNNPVWTSYNCSTSLQSVICEQNSQSKIQLEMLKKSHKSEMESVKKSHEIEKKSILENNKRNLEICELNTTTALDGLKKFYEKDLELLTEQRKSCEVQKELLKKSNENEKSIKNFHEIEIKSILEYNKRNLEICELNTTTALDGLKKLYEKDLNLLTGQRKSCEVQKELLKKSYENEKEHLLKDNNIAMTVLKNECQLKSQENEMSKKLHEKELNYLQGEKKHLYDLLTNRSIVYKNYSIMITAQGNRN